MSIVRPSAASENRLLRALRGLPVDRAPVWLMRQAGRYLPEYRALRAQAKSFFELCYTPAMATEITLQPIRRYGMDAAILFSDILVVADALGCAVSFVEGAGPRLAEIRNAADLDRLDRTGLVDRLKPVYETIRRLRQQLPAETALIGFAGAPWTVAAYMVEGGGAKEFYLARTFARRQPELFTRLIELLTEATIEHLRAQIEAGAEVLQLFDSWAGVLPPAEFARWCQAPLAEIVRALRSGHPEVPVIVFPRAAGRQLESFAAAVPAQGLSLDTSVPLAPLRRALPTLCLQGNLDPVALAAGGPALLDEAARIVEVLARGPFIFNLGHGVLPETDPDAVAALVEHVRSLRLPAPPAPAVDG